jgi:hypothetical protein
LLVSFRLGCNGTSISHMQHYLLGEAQLFHATSQNDLLGCPLCD